MSVGSSITGDRNFQAFIDNGIDVVENPSSPASGIYGNAYNNAKDSVGLETATIDGSQYLTGEAIVDKLAQAMQDLKSQLAQAQK